MAIDFVGGVADAVGNGADVTLDLTALVGGIASSPSENDFVIVWGFAVGVAAIETADYDVLFDGTNTVIAHKFMGPTPDSSVVCSGDGNAANAVGYVAMVFRGVDQTTPIDATIAGASGTSTNPDPPSCTPVTTGAVSVVFADSTVNDSSIVAPSGYSDLTADNFNETGVDITVAAAWKGGLTAGVAENPASFTTWSSGSWAAFTVLLRPAPAEFALSKTLAALTSSAAATVTIDAALSKTLGALTLSSELSAGMAAELGLAKTLGAATVSAAATVDVTVSLSKTLGAATLAAEAQATSAGEFALARTLGAVTVASAATVDIEAMVSKALDDATVSATATADAIIAAAEAVEGPHGPGWKLFGHDHHPVTRKRRRKVEDVEQDLIRAYEDATGITAERERLAAIRELKRAAATAASVARTEQDDHLARIAQQIIALKKFELTANAYLDRVGAILAVLQEQEDDDMEALDMILRLA